MKQILCWLLLVLGAGLCLTAGEVGPQAQPKLVWDHLPVVVYHGEEVLLHWQLDTADGLPLDVNLDAARRSVMPDQGVYRLRLPLSQQLQQIQIGRHGQQWARLTILRPGDQQPRHYTDGRLRGADGQYVILGLDRVEHEQDRRWAWLRPPPASDGLRCQHVVPAPATAWGRSPLLQQIANNYQAGQWSSVLVHMGTEDAYVGWRHRTYRQCLAWLVDDFRRRGAERLVLVTAPIRAQERERQQGLQTQVFDICRSYRCTAVRTDKLAAQNYWLLATGVLGRQLNAAGQKAMHQLVQPYVSKNAQHFQAREVLGANTPKDGKP